MPADLQALADAVKQRRLDLGLSQLDVWQAGGPSNTTLTKVENGTGPGEPNRKTLAKLDAGLQWEKGSAHRVLHGLGDAVPTSITLLPEVDPEGSSLLAVVKRLNAAGPAEGEWPSGVDAENPASVRTALAILSGLYRELAEEIDMHSEQMRDRHAHLDRLNRQLSALRAVMQEHDRRSANERSPITSVGAEADSRDDVDEDEIATAARRRKLRDVEPEDMDPAEFPELGAVARRGDLEPGEQDNDRSTNGDDV